jgi:hypothetical protein
MPFLRAGANKMGRQTRSQTQPISARWKINSIGYGGRALAVIAIFGIVLPLGFYLFARILDLYGVKNFIPLFIMKISHWTGAILAGLFFLLLTVEFLQDRILNRHYLKNKKYKLPSANGGYECQHCGARNITALDKRCPICGEDFQL